MMPEQPGPFESDEEGGEEDDFDEGESLLMIKCRLQVERKPCSCGGQCVKKNQGTLEMEICDYFMIIDATEEETIEYDSIEEN